MASRKTSAPGKRGNSGRRPAATGKRALWELRLYVAGMTPTSVRAFENLKKLCEEHLQGVYSIQIIDLLERPALASGDPIIAVPTLLRRLPTPGKKIIGDLS